MIIYYWREIETTNEKQIDAEKDQKIQPERQNERKNLLYL